MFLHRSSEFEPSVTAIQKHLVAVQDELANLGRIAGKQGAAAASNASDQIGEVMSSLLNDVVERFRDGGRQAVRLGSTFRNSAVQRVSSEVEDRPLVTLGVALGVGVLIGAAFLSMNRSR
jgi:ElaB/YqjD/DUF883 family membrane-anchored ribosome-binding protein